MKKIITIGMCLILCLCVSQSFAGIISSNNSFEIEGTGGPADALDWVEESAESTARTNSAARSGSWSASVVGGITEWSYVKQYFPQDLAGKVVVFSGYVMCPSSDPAVPWHGDWFAGNSVVVKLEQPDPSTAFIGEEKTLIHESTGPYDTWVYFAITNNSFPAGMSNFKAVCLGVMTGGTVYFDDVEVTVSADASTTNKLTLSSSSWYGGTVQAVPDQEWFLSNEVVTITASNNPGYVFESWSGDAFGSVNPVVLTMSVPRYVQAQFAPISIPALNSNVWETFDSPHWADDTWYGQEPNSDNKQFSYTNFDGRTCLAYHLINCGSNAQLHTDFGIYPNDWDMFVAPVIVMDIWTPDLGQPYSLRLIIKSDSDSEVANTNVIVDAEGWVTITAPINDSLASISLYWLAIGGFPGDPNLPAGKTTTFFIDKLYATGSGATNNFLIDDFTVNPTWVGSGSWSKRPRNWRYDTDSDYSFFPFADKNYHPIGIDPNGNHTNLCLILPFYAGDSTNLYAKIENIDNLYADMSMAAIIEADVMVTKSNTPVRFTFNTSNETEVTAYQTVQPSGWQHLSWDIPMNSSSFNWENVEKLGIMVRTEPGDADDATMYLDNISFVIPEPGMVLSLLGLLLLRRRKDIRF